MVVHISHWLFVGDQIESANPIDLHVHLLWLWWIPSRWIHWSSRCAKEVSFFCITSHQFPWCAKSERLDWRLVGEAEAWGWHLTRVLAATGSCCSRGAVGMWRPTEECHEQKMYTHKATRGVRNDPLSFLSPQPSFVLLMRRVLHGIEESPRPAAARPSQVPIIPLPWACPMAGR